jgi:integrase
MEPTKSARLDQLPAMAGSGAGLVDGALEVRGWLAGLVGGGLSASRAKHAYYVLFAVLEAAIQAGALLRNPAGGVRVRRSRRREMHFLSAAEVERLAGAIVPPYGLLVRFAAYTGLRAGELAALRVKRLDLLRGTVRVVESASEVDGRLVLGSTKTYAERTVRLPRFLREDLAVYLAGPATLTGSCSPPPGVGRCGTTTSTSASSPRRWHRRGCRHRSASMTCGTPARPC